MTTMRVSVTRTMEQQTSIDIEVPKDSDWSKVEELANNYIDENSLDWDNISENDRDIEPECDNSTIIYDLEG